MTHLASCSLLTLDGLFKQAALVLKEKEREVIDYYAADLTDMAVYAVNFWLLLQDARESERKLAVAKLYITEHLPQVRSAAAAIHAADSTPLEVRDAVLTAPF